jgi:hypothetical protein
MTLFSPGGTRYGRPPIARRAPWRRFESWLWTGPLGHLAGGLADFAQALFQYTTVRVLQRFQGHGHPARRGTASGTNV